MSELIGRPPVKRGGEPQVSGGLVFKNENPPALRATPLIRGAKT